MTLDWLAWLCWIWYMNSMQVTRGDGVVNKNALQVCATTDEEQRGKRNEK